MLDEAPLYDGDALKSVIAFTTSAATKPDVALSGTQRYKDVPVQQARVSSFQRTQLRRHHSLAQRVVSCPMNQRRIRTTRHCRMAT